MNRQQARQVATGLLVVAAGFQASLALGAPWGAAAFGGGHPGVLPTSLRGTSATAVVVYSGLAYVVWSGRMAAPVQRRAYAVLSGVFAVGTVMNAISPSMVEKVIWTPVVGLLAYSLWRARPDRAPAAAGALPAGIAGAA
jgi:hypothetical protein